jgi:hypothetical protein
MQSSAPTYRWVCHKCQASNESGAAQCSSCGFPAVASAQQINPIEHNRMNEEPTHDWLQLAFLFFPEIVIAAGFVLFSPYVAGSYFLAGCSGQGVFTILLAVGGTAGFVFAAKRKLRYVAWGCVAAIVLGMFLISDSCPKSIF